ncbi:reverse transcriptase domain-containing protein [Tanacetum coccineum]
MGGIARMMNVLRIEVKVDSKLVASQINGMYEASNGSMIKYLAKAREYISEFKTFSIENIPRGSNQKADVLSKLATVPFHNLTKEILVEVLNERSTEVQEVQTIVEEEGDNWMTPIIKYLEEGIVPSDSNEARALRAKIGQYTMESGVLFKKGYLIPMLRCVGPLQANYVIREIHMGSCGMHVGPRAVVRKAMRQGYYWPTMHADAKAEVDKCDSCQIHAPIPRLPKTFMTSIMAPWPFYQWGMDILGPLTPARGGAKFVVVAIDYFTKWVEAKPLVKITGKEIIRFVMDNIICRYGLPRIIVTDNGAQLWMPSVEQKYCCYDGLKIGDVEVVCGGDEARQHLGSKEEMWLHLGLRDGGSSIVSCLRRFGNEQMIKIISNGWSFVYAILGQMTYSVASLTLDSAGSYVMQGAPFTQGMIPSISIGGSISPEGFLPSILLLVVIIVTVVVVIVVFVDDVSLILKLSFAIIGIPVVRCSVLRLLNKKGNFCHAIVAVLPELWRHSINIRQYVVRMTSQVLKGYGMIHNDEDGDNDANDGDDDEREISWK